MSKNQKYYGRGTILKVIYDDNEIKCILAECFDENEVFQVISLDGYHTGCIKGYIYKEFRDNRGNFCTLEHLEQQLKERVFFNFKSFEIIKAVTSSQSDFDKIQKLLEKGGFKSPFQTDYNFE